MNELDAFADNTAKDDLLMQRVSHYHTTSNVLVHTVTHADYVGWCLFVSLQHNSTRRMAIANGTCVSFCNQPKAHFGLPWVRPWDNRGKCYMDGNWKEDSMLAKRIAAYTHLSSTVYEL